MMKTRRYILTVISVQIAVLLVPAGQSKAQWIVEDPAAIAQDAANQAANLAKYVEMVNNQVAQINTLTQQLNQIAAYTKAFGDPAKLLQVVGADALTRSLNQTGINRTLGELRELSNGVSALQYNANGLYNTVTDISFSGVAVPRPEEVYRNSERSIRPRRITSLYMTTCSPVARHSRDRWPRRPTNCRLRPPMPKRRSYRRARGTVSGTRSDRPRTRNRGIAGGRAGY